MNVKPIRVLVVDDSALVRKIVTNSLAPFPDIEVIGTAPDPYVARDRILELAPDVVTLDIEMPRMDGITFLKVLMKHRPMPIIVMSSLSQVGSEKAMEALQAGAVDVLGKPSGSLSAHEDGHLLAEKIRVAAHARIRPIRTEAPAAEARIAAASRSSPSPNPPNTPAISPGVTSLSPATPSSRFARAERAFPARKILLLGASTGGTEALKEVLTSMGGDLPGICIVQHIPAFFSRAFADRLNQICAMEVREAKHGDAVERGLALVAPGGYHMILKWTGSNYYVELNQGPPIHHQRPAVDILFDSALKCGAAPHAVAAVLTGMGADGAAGLLHLRNAGASTIAQNEETCVVFGMPREAIRLGGAQHVVPLDQIGRRLEQLSAHSSPNHVVTAQG